MSFGFVVMVPLALFSGLFCAVWANRKNLNPSTWAFIGAVFGPFAFIPLLFKRKSKLNSFIGMPKGKFVRRLFLIDLWIVILVNAIFTLSTIAIFFDYQATMNSMSSNEFYGELAYGSLSLVMTVLAILYLFQDKNKFTNFFWIVFSLYFINYISYIFMTFAHPTAPGTPNAITMSLFGLLVGFRTVLWPLYFQSLSLRGSNTNEEAPLNHTM